MLGLGVLLVDGLLVGEVYSSYFKSNISVDVLVGEYHVYLPFSSHFIKYTDNNLRTNDGLAFVFQGHVYNDLLHLIKLIQLVSCERVPLDFILLHQLLIS